MVYGEFAEKALLFRRRRAPRVHRARQPRCSARFSRDDFGALERLGELSKGERSAREGKLVVRLTLFWQPNLAVPDAPQASSGAPSPTVRAARRTPLRQA